MKLIRNAQINDDYNQLFDILYDEKIRDISPAKPSFDYKNVDRIIDIEGKVLVPGCIDAHVHFNDPGFTNHDDFYLGTKSAAYGGITTVIDMPCTSIPAVTNIPNLQQKLSVIESKALIDFALWGGIRQNDFPIKFHKIEELWNKGIVGFKLYTISGMESYKAVSYQEIEEMFRLFDGTKLLFAFHAEDSTIIENLEKSFTKEDLYKIETYVKSRPILSEVKAVTEITKRIKNNKVHFVHISSKKTGEIILSQIKDGKDISWETCPHYLQFTADDFTHLRGKLKTAPPVKFQEDKKFLRSSLIKQKIDFITTDHAGSDFETEKRMSDFSQVYNGIPGTQFMIPYLFTEFYNTGKMSLSDLIKVTSENAAKRYGFFPQKGSLGIGTDADFTIIDTKKPFIVDETELQCKGKYSPFHGMLFSASISKTIVRGEIVFDVNKGILVRKGFGQWIRRNEE